MNLNEVWDSHMLKVAWWIKSTWKDCPFDTFHITQNIVDIRLAPKPKPPRSWAWCPPTAGLLKCNVDGASKGNPGPSGIGGILWNENRRILGFFSLNSGHGWAFEAEVRAILNALIFCQEFLFRNIIIERDSSVAVSWVALKEKRPWRLLNELNYIDFLIHEVNCVEVRHIFRESNVEADLLANKGCIRTTPLWVCIGDTSEMTVLRDEDAGAGVMP